MYAASDVVWKDDAVRIFCGSTRFLCVLPVRQYGYAFQAFSWMLRAEAGANILTKDGTLLQDRGAKREQTRVSLVAF